MQGLQACCHAGAAVSRLLHELEPTTQAKAVAALAACKGDGLDVLVYQTYRSREEQKFEYAKGRTAPGKIVTWAEPGMSWHQWGRALDVVPRRNGKVLVWGTHGNGLDQDVTDDATDDLELWQRVAQHFKEQGFTWGGDWGKGKRDFPHFENRGGLTLKWLNLRFPAGLTPGHFV